MSAGEDAGDFGAGDAALSAGGAGGGDEAFAVPAADGVGAHAELSGGVSDGEEGCSANSFLIAAVIASLPSESIFILHTADLEASLNCSSGIPIASSIFPPYWFIIATSLGSTDDEPCRTIGNPGIFSSISLSISSLIFGSIPGLNLKAPCDVPIDIARLSTPVLLTKS